jgi:molybdate transport system permease protein
MLLTDSDLQALWLTIQLALLVTVILLLIATPIAWWLTRTQSRWKAVVAAVIAMPLILPPTVLGFYLLLAMGPHGVIGQFTQSIGLGGLVFTFWGLVVGSVIYSLPFVVQPIHNAFESVGDKPLEAAATLGAGAWDRFFTVLIPMASPGFLTAATLGFAHTLGEFGVVLMIGGSIPGETKLVSIQIYEHVEALDYASAHSLSAVMLLMSFLMLLALFLLPKRYRQPETSDV